MKCKHCNREMILDISKILLSNPPKQIYTCPKCGSVEYVTSTTVPYDLGLVKIEVDENNSYPATSKLEIETPSDEEMEIRADERRKVVEEIREGLIYYTSCVMCENCGIIQPDNYIKRDGLNEILDKVEKGDK